MSHFSDGSVSSYSQKQPTNAVLDPEYHKNVIVRDVARNFGRQDSSSTADLLFGSKDSKDSGNGSKETYYPEIDEVNKEENHYMSPIVSYYRLPNKMNMFFHFHF